jgi:sugar-specific transcriptional regulator TrmB
MEETIVSRLRELGFSLYEARVYVALLRGGSSNGNEVAKRAGVPSSKVYAALEKLTTTGVVHSTRRGSSTRWVAAAPEELIARLRRQYNDPLDFLANELPKVRAADPPEPFLTVGGLAATREAAVALISAAKDEIHISCWQVDFDVLESALADADRRDVRVFGMLYGDAEPETGSWLHHHYEEIVAERVGGRLLALVADDGEALVARIPVEGGVDAVRSRNPAMTLIVREYLHHDSVLQRAQMSIGFDEWDRWWQADPEVRSEILGSVMAAAGENEPAKSKAGT